MNRLKRLTTLMLPLAAGLLVAGAQAAPITGEFTADNNMMMVVKYGPNDIHTVLPSNAGQSWAWKKARSLKFNLRDMNRSQIKACSVNIIAWGDRSGSGLAGWIKNAADPSRVVYTGQGRIRYLPSNASFSSGNNTPSQQQIASLVNAGNYASSAPASQHRVDVQRPWTTAVNWQQPRPAQIQQNANSYKWIWSYPNFTGRADNKYASFSIPCGELVGPKTKPRQDWVDVPGDHFQCYGVRPEDKIQETSIETRDQFGKRKLVVGQPVMLCNPAEKIHRGKTYKVENQKRHLVCYQTTRENRPANIRVETKNQFGTHQMRAQRPRMFCVPSLKKHLSSGGVAHSDMSNASANANRRGR